jgi:hypothetical protein
MKLSRNGVRRKARAVPDLKFETQSLTSFAGLVIFQKFFAVLNLKEQLRACFRGSKDGKVYDRAIVFLQLIVHLLLGYRELKECRHYRHDPLVKRVLGLNRLPDVATLSRMLKEATVKSVENLRRLLRQMVLGRLQRLGLARVTLDFDGSVQSTRRHAEGTAVGFNKKKKGARSYYPLFCTIAQMAQVLDVLHRPGNVHDSNGAQAFILACIDEVRRIAPYAVIEVRMDSAFFSDEIVMALESRGIELSISVPFERFPKLKGIIEQRQWWWLLNRDTSYFELSWKPDCWKKRFRFLVIRSRTKQQHKGPIQLDLFVPHDYGYEFKVIVTNKTVRTRAVVAFHDGRGSQEGIFAELKSHCHLDYVPVRTLHGNQTYLLAGLFAYNLTRELQMRTGEPTRGTTANRATLWVFEKLDTVRKTLIQRAGRLTRPGRTLTLTISGGRWMKQRLLHILGALPGNT